MAADYRVAVVGGGISGLATAFRIRERARARGRSLALSILERDDRCGGKIDSLRDHGFLCETGPNGFLNNEPATLRLVSDLGLTAELLPSNDEARQRFIYHSGRMHRIEMHPLRFMTSSLLSPRARLRVLGELFTAARKDGVEETVREFGRRRLGAEFVDVMLDSMVSGIFAGDVNRLSIQAAFPKVPEMERQYGGLIRAMRAKSRQARGTGETVSAGPGGTLHSFRGGMAQPLETLVERLGTSVHTATAVQTVERLERQRGFRLRFLEGSIEADAIVLAVPAPQAAEILRSLAPAASDALEQIPVAGVHVVCTGYRKSEIGHPLDGFGALIPRREGLRVLGSIWSSSTFRGRAPRDQVLMTTMIGGAHDSEANRLSDDDLLTLVRREVHPIYDIRAEPTLVRTIRWPQGIPQYTVGHHGRVSRARAALEQLQGVFLTGNSIAGVSFNHCVADAERIAEQLVTYLDESRLPDRGERVGA